jgi:hypothetical protein
LLARGQLQLGEQSSTKSSEYLLLLTFPCHPKFSFSALFPSRSPQLYLTSPFLLPSLSTLPYSFSIAAAGAPLNRPYTLPLPPVLSPPSPSQQSPSILTVPCVILRPLCLSVSRPPSFFHQGYAALPSALPNKAQPRLSTLHNSLRPLGLPLSTSSAHCFTQHAHRSPPRKPPTFLRSRCSL